MICSEVLLHHAIGEDLQRYGTPNHWSSAGFESNRRRMQLRIAQSTTHFEGSLVRGFLLEKELRMMLSDVANEHQNPIVTSLLKQISSEGVTRLPKQMQLREHWYIPTLSELDMVSLAQHHKIFLHRYYGKCQLSSRIVAHDRVYSSRHYWSRPSDTVQDCVAIAQGRGFAYGRVVAFVVLPGEAAEPRCLLLWEEFTVADPFEDLAEMICSSNDPSMLRSRIALLTVQETNTYFKKITQRSLRIQDAYSIVGPATIASFNNQQFVYRL